MHVEPSHWLHEISISKTVGHHFWPGLMAYAEIWGHSVGNLLCGRPVGQMWSGGGLLLVVCFHRVHPLQ